MTTTLLATTPASRIVRIGGHEVDLDRRTLLDAAGRSIELRPQAIELLCLLAEHAGEVVDKHRAIDRVWPGMVVTDDSLVQAIGDIRRALGDDKHQVVQTVPRRGYRLIAYPAATAGTRAAGAAATAAATSKRRRLA